MGLKMQIEIDDSEFQATMHLLQTCMTPEKFNQAMYGIFQRTGRHVAKILKQDLPKEYNVKAGAIGGAVQTARVTNNGTSSGCVIPIRDHRGSIGKRYGASGGKHGWNSLRGKRYSVKARILAGAQSTLPGEAPTGYPPFRNLGSSIHPLTWARKSKKRFPIMKMVGIAIPQMPKNRSEADVQKDIRDYMVDQMEHRLLALIKNGR